MGNPFDLDDDDAYQRWRDNKLAHAIVKRDDLIVEIKNPGALTASERTAILDRCQRSNMAIYVTRALMDENLLQSLGKQLGLERMDANWLAGEQGVSHITVSDNGDKRQSYIPYTDRAIKWHTDGYYNPPERTIRGMLLHCVQSAGSGGKNRLLDHEMAYQMLRDENGEYIQALSAMDVMTIPERIDDIDGIRPAQTGPVFSVDGSGHLHMRYTARTRSIVWKQDATTLAAVAMLEKLLLSDTPYIHSLHLESGMGLICNNVLHDRSAFTHDPAKPRLLYRARFLDRMVEDYF